MLCLHAVLKAAWRCRSVILSKFIKKSNIGKIRYTKIEKNLANAITLASSNEFFLYCPQYAQFIRLLERLLTLHCGAKEEFVQRFRRSITVQSKKQLIEALQYDEQGTAFSTSEGNDVPWREKKFRENWETTVIFICCRSLVFSGFICFLLLLHWVF